MDRLFDANNKKIVLGFSLQEIDLFIKTCVVNNKKTISNYEKFTINSLTTLILQSIPGNNNIQFLNNECANAIFYSFLKDNIDNKFVSELIPKESFSLETSKDAYRAINQIRNGLVKKEDHKLIGLINEYEKYLISINKFDESLILKEANKIIKSNRGNILKILGFNNNVSFYLLPSLKNRLSYQETIFINELTGLKNFDDIYIKFNDKDEIIEKVKAPTYGYSNEIKYVIDTIINNNYNLADVSIYTSTNAYDNMLKAYFENANINYTFINDENIMNEDYTSFFVSILDFLGKHFNIEHLYSLYKNPALAINNNGNHLYSYTSKLKELRADKEQIINKVNSWTDQGKKQFVLDLIVLHNENDNIGEIFKKVYEFTNKYTKPLSHKYVKDALFEKQMFFNMFDSFENDYSKKTDFIKSIISTINITKNVESKDSSYITINSIDATFLHRKYNFFIGLSANELMRSEIESPLISDDKYKEMLDCDNYYVRLGKAVNEEQNEHLHNLLNTQIEGKQYFITSVYDSVEFKPLSKSSFYITIPVNEENVFYSIENINVNNADPIDEYLYPQNQEDIDKVNNLDLSPSAIGDIINCPLKHIYNVIYEDIELDSYKDKWLKGGEEGTFAHEVLKEYFENYNKKSVFDGAEFDKCFNKVYNDIKNDHPFSNTHIQDIEAQKVKNMIEEYLNRYYANKDEYVPFKFELDIAKGFCCKYPDSRSNYQIHGIIDRVDAYVDDNKDLKIRIIDYKTEKEIFKSDKTIEKMTQDILYPKMISKYINDNINEFESEFGKFNTKTEYNVEFVYEFIKLKKAETFKDDYDLIKQIIDTSLENYEKLIANPTWNNFVNIYNPAIKTKKNHDEGKCEYCPYIKCCRIKIKKGDNQVW